MEDQLWTMTATTTKEYAGGLKSDNVNNRSKRMSETTMNVYQRLNAAREEFHGLQLKKTGHNKFAGYQYFELGDFLIPALKTFKAHGLCATVSFEPTMASMTIRNVDKPEEVIVLTSPMGSAALKGCHEVQNIGAVETYQRRYLWVAALEIVEHDALDATTGKDAPKSSKTVAKDTFDNQAPETQSKLEDWRVAVMDGFEESDEAGMAKYVEAKAAMTADEQVAFWHLFDSKTRSYIKKLGSTTEKATA